MILLLIIIILKLFHCYYNLQDCHIAELWNFRWFIVNRLLWDIGVLEISYSMLLVCTSVAPLHPLRVILCS